MVATRLVRGDITTLEVDAVVNAANSTLLSGGGVDGAIHNAAGPELLEACRKLGGCPTGEARITPGFGLRARWIIHTVGPVWKGGGKREAELLASCYHECLKIAEEHSVKTIAFPAISTGVYAYPIVQATEVAIREVANFGRDHPLDMEVVFCCYSGEDYSVYKNAQRATGA